MKLRSLFILLYLLTISCYAQQTTTLITKEKAIQLAEADGKFTGTWINGELKNNQWHITARSKSANPPMYYIVNAVNGKVLLKLDNSDDPKQKEKLKVFLGGAKKSIK